VRRMVSKTVHIMEGNNNLVVFIICSTDHCLTVLNDPRNSSYRVPH
jgi:hypothetical protein